MWSFLLHCVLKTYLAPLFWYRDVGIICGDQGNLMGLSGAGEAVKALAGSRSEGVELDTARAGRRGYHSGMVQILVILNK